MSDKSAPDQAFDAMVAALKDWAEHHMDQWERFKFQTSYGPVYVSISMQAEHPDSFDAVDE